MLVGILAAMVIPMFVQLTRSGDEGTSKGNLGAIRSALSIYYGDMEGLYPTELEALTLGGKYMPSLPMAKAPPYHRQSSKTHSFPSRSQAASSDLGGWAFIDNPSDPDFGSVWVNCSHTDTRGSVWNSY